MLLDQDWLYDRGCTALVAKRKPHARNRPRIDISLSTGIWPHLPLHFASDRFQEMQRLGIRMQAFGVFHGV